MADRLFLNGGKRLQGEVRASGAKNAALPIINAALLGDGESQLEDIPHLRDVIHLQQILEHMGVRVSYDQGVMTINPQQAHFAEPPYELVRKLRASYYLLGVLLARNGEARIALPGGCAIGNRPIDLHLKGFKALGAEIHLDHGVVEVRAPRPLNGARIYLDYPSVGATINIMLAACGARGQTIIENAAREPEIIDLANMLTVMGARIKGVGTDIVKVEGIERLGATQHRIIPDRIESGSYMIAAAATRGDVYVRNSLCEHLKSLLAKLKEMGARIEEDIEGVRVTVPNCLRGVDVKTLPHPGFPTDLQPQMMALLTQAGEGTSLVIETVFENRFMHVDELKRMGADIKMDGRGALVKPSRLSGARVWATDLRAGVALIIAGLSAEGETQINDFHHVERGYEKLEEKFKGLGADLHLE